LTTQAVLIFFLFSYIGQKQKFYANIYSKTDSWAKSIFCHFWDIITVSFFKSQKAAIPGILVMLKEGIYSFLSKLKRYYQVFVLAGR